MHRTNRLSLLMTATALGAIGLPASAQERPTDASDAPEVRDDEAGETAEPILVTGTRIRGAEAVAETVTIEREAIVEAGQVDLGEAVRSLPQNFSGGQNPGVGFGDGLVNNNVNSASNPNLRGLGADATLTLLNGHRLPYNSAFQGVDISAIPLAAVDRVEVLPDGASALYGSDAVGGVINVILRRDFQGVTTSAQLGTSTDGGNFRQQFDAVAGTLWSRGSMVLAYDFANNSAISADNRSYTQSLVPDATLYPKMQRHAATLGLSHDLSAGISFSMDALYSHRRSEDFGGSSDFRIERRPKTEAYAIAPAVEFDLGSDWEASLSGVYGRDRTRFRTSFVPTGGNADLSAGEYLNEVFSVEAGAEGPLFDLPGGSARLAVGAGLKNNGLAFEIKDSFYDNAFDVERRSRHVYAEIYLPFVAPSTGVGGIRELTFSGALRYEDYPDLDQIVTPRVGLIYSPFESLKLRASWSRSFKAPTLYQQFIFYEAVLLPASLFGTGSETDAVLATAGGNPDVGPERARSWSLGVEFEPDALPGLRLSASWYDIKYSDRVTSPISGSILSALLNPGYASLIDFSPSPAGLEELVSGALNGLQNFTGITYDPDNVIAVIDNRNINVATWQIEGVDAQIAWDRDLGRDRTIGFEVSGSWLNSSQTIVAELPAIELAGSLFNPSRFRMRGTARGSAGRFDANASINIIGALVDRRFEEEDRIGASATFDLGLSYEIIRGEGRDPGLEVSLSVQNLFNDKPETIRQPNPFDTPFDSTNYSPIGRFVAVGVRRHW